MTTAHDVAKFIEQRCGHHLGKADLQKLLYYAQAWSLVWDGITLFDDRIEAWPQGPVTRDVWTRRQHGIAAGDAGKLSHEQRETVSAVLEFYGHLTGPQLIALTHRERPWVEARRGLRSDEPSKNPITPAALRHYFGALGERGKKTVPDPVRRGAWVLLSTPEDAVDDLFTDDSGGDGFTAWLESDEENPWDE